MQTDREVDCEDDDLHHGRTGRLHENEAGSSSDKPETSYFHAGHRGKTAYYNAASEKSLSQEEAKLFYQRHKLEQSQQDLEGTNSLLRAKTFPSALEIEGSLSYSETTAAQQSIREQALQDRMGSLQTAAAGPKSQSSTIYGSEEVAKQGVQLETDIVEPAWSGSDISPELSAISGSIKRVLETRHKYINLSLQSAGDNPKDRPGWKIYPPPPNPTWDDNKNRPISQLAGKDSMSNSRTMTDESTNQSQGRLSSDPPMVKPRKPGLDIGEDFDMADLLPLPGLDENVSFRLDESSVYQIFRISMIPNHSTALVRVPTLRDFYRDMDEIQGISSDGPTKSFAYRQLDIIEGKFHLYFLVNSYQETADCKRVPHRDFYNVRKVDTHVHHSACMNQKHLLRFIKSKMKKSPDEIVMFRDKKELTLQQVFESINLTAYDLSIDTLDMHAHTDSFHRFDKFNLKYNPIGESRLREIFIKTDNYIHGRYLAEITKEVISDLESSKYQFVEWRVSIYGRSIDEWDKLAAWVVNNRLVSHNVRWVIQIPRLYSLFKANCQMDSFEQILVNIFWPLFEVTKNPSNHPKLHIFLQRVIGFDSVDDESKTEVRLYRKYPPPKEWNTKQNPPYTYWIYHLFANMTSLNHWRQRRGFNTFVLRPHCGEAGDVDHIAAAVLCCHSISHGLMLRKVPLLQYIFYLDQIGIAMSPLSNNALFIAYDRNPFSKYFKRGLNVSLSTDDPLQFAFTKEPLIEEYSVAAQIYRLSAVDMCELAQHSVVQSGFEHELKQRWLGPKYHLPGLEGNNVAKSNVPSIRKKFRHDTLVQELEMLDRYAAATGPLRPTSAPIPAPPSPSTNILPSRATLPITFAKSDAIIPSVDHSEAPQSGNNCWTDVAPPLPRIFPGVVHERTRRGSVRQGSSSEKDAEGVRAPRPLPWERGTEGLELGAVLPEQLSAHVKANDDL